MCLSYAISNMEAPTDVSLSLSFRPWWRLWQAAVLIFLFVGVVVGLHVALKFEFPKKNDSRDER